LGASREITAFIKNSIVWQHLLEIPSNNCTITHPTDGIESFVTNRPGVSNYHVDALHPGDQFVQGIVTAAYKSWTQ